MSKAVIVLLVVIVLAVGGYLYYSNNNVEENIAVNPPPPAGAVTPPPAITPPANNVTPPPPAQQMDAVVTITNQGFSPATLTVKQGARVTFRNTGTQESWPASAQHPTHTVYPGSGIQKCGTAEAATIFDACKGLKNGESWSFIFNEKGTWNYHDHVRSGLFGKIVVE